MRANWLWKSWATLTLATMIALEVSIISFTVMFIIPKFQRLCHDGMIDAVGLEKSGVSWMVNFLNGLGEVGGHYTPFMLIAAVAACGLFEWRVNSENKAFIRLSAMGTAALGLMVVVMLTAASLVIPFLLAMPAMSLIARPFAVEQVAIIDTSIRGIEQALAKMDWGAMQEQAEQASIALNRLSDGTVAYSLTEGNEPTTVEEFRERLNAARRYFREVQQAIRNENGAAVETALQQFRKSYGPVRETGKRLAK